jgi:GT2 family glycosyltransferase
MKLDLTSSIVTYENDPCLVKNTVESFLNNKLKTNLFIIDNSSTPRLGSSFTNAPLEYIFNDRNIGFGKAHNKCIAKILDSSKYHLVLNPDVTFPRGTLEKLYDFMENNPNVGLVMPKVLDEQNQIQFLCKRLPDPFALLIRRFGFELLNKMLKKRFWRYEMREKNYDESFEVPYLSGCFMFVRVEALKKIGLFDERFFMYMEDADISRRIHKHYKTVYYPRVHIFHGHARDSYKISRHMLTHITSAIRYFNKWGWFFDHERKIINRRV